jgi:hypothetical protein
MGGLQLGKGKVKMDLQTAGIQKEKQTRRDRLRMHTQNGMFDQTGYESEEEAYEEEKAPSALEDIPKAMTDRVTWVQARHFVLDARSKGDWHLQGAIKRYWNACQQYHTPCYWGDLLVAVNIGRKTAEANDGIIPLDHLTEVYCKDVFRAINQKKGTVYDWDAPENDGLTYQEVMGTRPTGQPEEAAANPGAGQAGEK